MNSLGTGKMPSRKQRTAALRGGPKESHSAHPSPTAAGQNAPADAPPRKVGSSWIGLAITAAAGLGLAIVIGGWWWGNDGLLDAMGGAAAAPVSNFKLEEIPFNGARAYDYLKQLCDIGPRPSGSEGMRRQQQLLEEHFTKLGGKVVYQRFRGPHPQTKQPVEMANMIVHWHPESRERVLLCAHYDTLPYPMLDPRNPRGRFVGANDNASGVAVLMELAHDIPKLKTKYGIDLLMIDAEEFIFTERDRYFLGSEYFARDYAESPPPYRYRWGVLLDMIGDKDLTLYQERNSLRWKDTRPLVEHIWSIAQRLQVREFIARPKYEIRDDHVMLHELGKISCIDIIDFDYPPWHTEADVPENCSPLSLAKVGWVVRTWLEEAK